MFVKVPLCYRHDLQFDVGSERLGETKLMSEAKE